MKKQKTLGARLSAATTELDSALGVFENVAQRLDSATAAHELVRDEAVAEAARLSGLAHAAQRNIDRSQAAAQRVRELVA